ncbi:MAG: 3-phosphoshikimate 1-carboxyvinyltransferase [Clostridia bacterium]|nr:3-phosphoshikimate 1-carboxyvinyltransferase [Clostridia bacterium]
MKIKICPSKAAGKVFAPPSKSVAHRCLISAFLADGESKISPIQLSDDVSATIDAIKALGGKVEINDGAAIVRGGIDVSDGAVINCRESGSTLRFLIPICLLTGKKITLVGTEKLLSRPLSVYEDICRRYGFLFEKTKDSLTVSGRLKADRYVILGDISSQFITGLLFALPTLHGDSEIVIDGKFESASYVDITLQVLKTFGVIIEKREKSFFIRGGQRYTHCSATVEADESSSAFLDALGLFGAVEVIGRNPETKQGDKVYTELFKRLTDGQPTVDISDCPDLAPVIMTLAAIYRGATLVGTRRLKLKESDRGAAMAEELKKFGAEIDVGDDVITVKKADLHTPVCELSSHNDHRIVMAMSVVASIYGGVIDGAEAVNKSYPNYFKTIKELGIELYETE